MAWRTSGGLRGNSNAGGYDVFLVKYSKAGAQQWLDQLGTASADSAAAVAAGPAGYVYVTGTAKGGLYGNTNSGGEDVFLARYL